MAEHDIVFGRNELCRMLPPVPEMLAVTVQCCRLHHTAHGNTCDVFTYAFAAVRKEAEQAKDYSASSVSSEPLMEHKPNTYY
ncbi:hypothetical protein BAUCODRAFT_276563 [Baudoinia panamericana UAMH 10762]|uniref:Uncharacterized protein n=1 Tax=Baudoinia panamericana (strain UAMH 10762) TaxID=717646 RepID=M2LDR6_BAUPA|nr:uncharacterized protein BAUCODRAFT_276563 [Baudoinia panamericana UAMH 10762]EMC92122.1 hypothetical protein BAUCODRAFT_276563 [Baudoinia panamericana UAMH 10762]